MSTRADTTLWHPFADMAAVRDGEFVITRGEGVWLFDESGKRYLDGSASLWYCNIVHGGPEVADAGAEQMRQLGARAGAGSLWYGNLGPAPPEIADAVAEQMRPLEAWSVFGNYATPPAHELAD